MEQRALEQRALEQRALDRERRGSEHRGSERVALERRRANAQMPNDPHIAVFLGQDFARGNHRQSGGACVTRHFLLKKSCT